GALLSAAYSLRLIVHVFFGPQRAPVARAAHDPPAGMWLPVAVLGLPVVLLGVPPALATSVVRATALAAAGGELPAFQLALWHGFSAPLAMSVAALGGGALLLWRHEAVDGWRRAWPRPDAMRLFQVAVAGLVRAARRFMSLLDNRSLPRYLGVIVTAILVVVVSGYWRAGGAAPGGQPTLPANVPAITGWL